MVSGPPDWSTLDRRGPKESHEKLDWATRTEGFVAEVAVVKASDGKHANDVHANTQSQRGPREADPKDSHTRDVKQNVWNGLNPPDPPFGDVWFVIRLFNEMIRHKHMLGDPTSGSA